MARALHHGQAGSTVQRPMESIPRYDEPGLNVLVVGNDMLIEALPAKPIQLAHACGKAGFDLVVPLSWGDELVADAALGELQGRGPHPAILCACPLVRQRLLSTGTELASAMVSMVSPPIAVSRHLRAILGSRVRSLAFAGRCPSARPPDYDIAFDPTELKALLRSRGIEVVREPELFEDTIPPDRRRFSSLPGGCPTPDLLWHRCNERVAVDLESADLPVDLAQLLLTPDSLLVDVAPVLGCACSGVTPATASRQARIAVTSLEPPRAQAPILEAAVGIELVSELRPMPASRAAPVERQVEAGAIAEGPTAPAAGRESRAPLAITPSSALRIPDRSR